MANNKKEEVVTNISVIDLGKLSRPATELVKKVAEGISGVARPFQTIRMAKAEARASIIATEARLQIDELEQRALQRFIGEEARNQANIESITKKAIPLLSEDSKPSEVDNDWITNFFSKSRLISDEEMQVVWAKVLAGEANNPSSFSKRTVNLLGDLGNKEAEIFAHLCNFTWEVSGPLIFYGDRADFYKKRGLGFQALSHLEELGLIQMTGVGYSFDGVLETTFLKYGNRILKLKLETEHSNKLPCGNVIFTKAGHELSRLCDRELQEGVFEMIKDILQKWAVSVEEVDRADGSLLCDS